MSRERGPGPHVWPNAVALVLLLTAVISLRGCTSDSADWSSSREIVVKLHERDKRLRTVGSNQAPLLLYGADTLTIFDGLPHLDSLEIRQSFPEFSQRWRDEQRWRAGRHDSTALAALPIIVSNCPGIQTADSVAILNLVSRWNSDLAVARAGSAAVESVVQLLQFDSSVSPVDSLAVLDLLNDLQTDGTGIGVEDLLVVPAMRRLRENCPLGVADSLAILGFADRLVREGGVAGISDLAIPAIVDLIEGRRLALRDSLALVSYIRLLHGEDAFGQRQLPPSVDLFLRVEIKGSSLNLEDVLPHIRAIPEVEYAVPAIPDAPEAPVFPQSARAAQASNDDQPYLKSETWGGVDAHYAWGAVGGKGEKVMVMVIDASWEQHPDLPDHIYPYDVSVTTSGDRNPPGFPEASKNNISHGTEALGVLAARHNGTGVMGICPKARDDVLLFATTLRGGVHGAIDTILADPRVQRGDVLVIEAQQHVEGSSRGAGCCASKSAHVPRYLPAEANPDIHNAIQWATSADYGIVVVEAAGNGGGELVQVTDDGVTIWNPESDSGSIIVGAGNGFNKSHSRIAKSNYGERVDCQGWGSDVMTTTVVFADEGSTRSDYNPKFGNTSSATAIVGGVAASLQSAHIAAKGYPLSSQSMRCYLRHESYGSPQPADEGADRRIGPLPNLIKLLSAFQIEGGGN